MPKSFIKNCLTFYCESCPNVSLILTCFSYALICRFIQRWPNLYVATLALSAVCQFLQANKADVPLPNGHSLGRL